jgi:hypothetical protein
MPPESLADSRTPGTVSDTPGSLSHDPGTPSRHSGRQTVDSRSLLSMSGSQSFHSGTSFSKFHRQ